MNSGIAFVIVVFVLLLLWWPLHYIMIDLVDKLSFKQLERGDVYIHKHFKQEHQYDMYFNHVIVVGKDVLENGRRIVRFRDFKTNVYQTLDWHEFRYSFEYANKNLF